MRRYPIQRNITKYVYKATLYSQESDKVRTSEFYTFEPLTFKAFAKMCAKVPYKPVKLILLQTETELRGMDKKEFYKYSAPYDEAEKPVTIKFEKEIK